MQSANESQQSERVVHGAPSATHEVQARAFD
jgi:hypothetical protein